MADSPDNTKSRVNPRRRDSARELRTAPQIRVLVSEQEREQIKINARGQSLSSFLRRRGLYEGKPRIDLVTQIHTALQVLDSATRTLPEAESNAAQAAIEDLKTVADILGSSR